MRVNQGRSALRIFVVLLLALMLSSGFRAGVSAQEDVTSAPPATDQATDTGTVEGVDSAEEPTDSAPPDEATETVRSSEAESAPAPEATEATEVTESAPSEEATQVAEEIAPAAGDQSAGRSESAESQPLALNPESGGGDEFTVAEVANGSLTVRAIDTLGDPVEGTVCFSEFLDAGGGTHGAPQTSLCNTPGQPTGVIFDANRAPGNYVIAITSVPVNYTGPSSEAVYSVASNLNTDLPFVFTFVGGTDTGSILVHKTDDADPANALPTACFEVWTDDNGLPGTKVVPATCDFSNGADDGSTAINNVPVGDYLLVETQAPAGYQAGDPTPVTVVKDTETEVTVVNGPEEQLEQFELTAVDGSDNPVEGACFEIYTDLGGGALGDLIVGGTDLCSDSAGFVLSRNQEPGDYVAVNVVAPDGFGTPDNKTFSVSEGEVTPVKVVLSEVTPDTPGKLVIHKRTNLQVTLPGACFTLFENNNGHRGDQIGSQVCDDDDSADDGTIQFSNIPPGDILAAETVQPVGFETANDSAATIKPGQRTFLTILDGPDTSVAGFIATVEDENGDPVEGACFVFRDDLGGGEPGDILSGGGELCSDEDGFILSRNQEAGDYIAVNLSSPAGFGTADDKLFTVFGDDPVPVVIVLPTVTPSTPGKLVITKHDLSQNLLPGACFRVFEDSNGERGDSLSAEVCDDDDSDNDGTITIVNLPPGSILLAETVAPDGFGFAFDTAVVIKPGQRAFVTVTDLAEGSQPTGFAFFAKDEDGNPVEGACFQFFEDAGNGELGELLSGSGTVCSDAAGQVLTRNQEAGNYVAKTVTTPDGFDTPANKRFAVEDGHQTQVVVTFVEGSDQGGNGNGTDDDDDEDDVTTLPSTGAGFETGSVSIAVLIALLLGSLGAFGFARRAARR